MKRIGIIGYGGFGRFLHNAWKSLGEAGVTAVADKNPNAAPGGEIRFFTNWRDLIRDPDIDIISIAAPPSEHVEMACAAMEAGKHILVEKPLAIGILDGERIIRTRDKTGKTASVNFMMRFNPLVEAVGHLTGDKTLGELRRVVVENYAQDESLPPEHWFWNRSISGGILIEHAVHFIDLVQYLTGKRWVRASGMLHRRNDNQEDQVMAALLHEGGLFSTHYHAFNLPGFFEHTSFRLVYDLARVELEGWIQLEGSISALVNDETEHKLHKLPNFKVTSSQNIGEIRDISRPEGWGMDNPKTGGFNGKIRSGGVEYPVTRKIQGRFHLDGSKGEVYSRCLQDIMKDLVRAIEHPEHPLRVTL